MTDTKRQTWFPENHYYVPDAAWARCGFTILRAGKAVTAREHRIERESYHGQDILFCTSGRGYAKSEGRTLSIKRGQLIWIANERPHAHWPDIDDPWSVFFVRIDGPDCAAVRRKVFGSGTVPTIAPNPADMEAWFAQLFEALRVRAHNVDMVLNRLVAELLCTLASPSSRLPEARLPSSLQAIVMRMRQAPERSWRSDEMASVTSLSAAQIRRLFQKHLQVSPRHWLTRERIMLSQKMLLETNDTISVIADRCGFCDVYHFSREFKRSTGISPRAWKKAEGHYGQPLKSTDV